MEKILDLGGAVAALQEFHSQHLLAMVPGGPPKLVFDGQLKLSEEARLREITTKFSLPEPLLERLENAFQPYTDQLNKVYGREFWHHRSPNLAVDPVAVTEDGGILTFDRRGTRAFVGGGLVDPHESMQEAAAREGSEESGGGCTYEVDPNPVFVVDSVRAKMPVTYFFSAVFSAKATGVPRDNAEASNFASIKPDQIGNHKWFMDHELIARMVSDLSNKTEEVGAGIPYTGSIPLVSAPYSLPKPYLPPMTDPNDIAYVTGVIERVEGFYLKLRDQLQEEVLSRIEKEPFLRSRNVIAHGWEDRNGQPIERTEEENTVARAWNDNARLWDFMGPVKVAAIKISGNFNHFVNMGEGGVIETVSAYTNGDKVFLGVSDGKFILEHELLTQLRDFPTTIGYHASKSGVEIVKPPVLVGAYEPPSYRNAKGIRVRAFEFLATTEDGKIPAGTKAFSFEEAAALPKEAWASGHDYRMFQTLATHQLKVRGACSSTALSSS